MDEHPEQKYDIFLSHSHSDAVAVESLAKKLADDKKLKPWLDKWEVVPGGSWQQAIERGLEESKCCAVCLGAEGPGGWFKKEYEAAINRQASDPSFRVIPLLLPGADPDAVSTFLKSNDWIDFRSKKEFDYMFYRLVCGVRGVKPGRWEPPGPESTRTETGFEKAFDKALEKVNEWVSRGLVSEEEAKSYRDRIAKRYLDGITEIQPEKVNIHD